MSESSEHVASFLIRPSEYPLINGELSDVYSYVNHTSTLRLAYNLTCNPESHCFVYSNNSTPYSSSGKIITGQIFLHLFFARRTYSIIVYILHDFTNQTN